MWSDACRFIHPHDACLQVYARFEVFTAVKSQVEVFWIVTPCTDVVQYQDEDGGSMDL
jgi:hypothetical protein